MRIAEIAEGKRLETRLIERAPWMSQRNGPMSLDRIVRWSPLRYPPDVESPICMTGPHPRTRESARTNGRASAGFASMSAAAGTAAAAASSNCRRESTAEVCRCRCSESTTIHTDRCAGGPESARSTGTPSRSLGPRASRRTRSPLHQTAFVAHSGCPPARMLPRCGLPSGSSVSGPPGSAASPSCASRPERTSITTVRPAGNVCSSLRGGRRFVFPRPRP
ncbi:unannotated protein [freshwater metagenome]|uniref:Unannotated protein n=1 Tax=freshwater metagenome TaxID=449393 RepID=A0A6J6ZYV3_9ZZZZ